MDMANGVQNLDKDVCFSHSVNTPGKINLPTSSSFGCIMVQTRLRRKKNFEFKRDLEKDGFHQAIPNQNTLHE